MLIFYIDNYVIWKNSFFCHVSLSTTSSMVFSGSYLVANFEGKKHSVRCQLYILVDILYQVIEVPLFLIF